MVECNKSRVEKFFTIIFERREIKISYRPVLLSDKSVNHRLPKLKIRGV